MTFTTLQPWPTLIEIDRVIDALDIEITTCSERIAGLAEEQAQLAPHPHHDWFTAGGLAVACGLVSNDIAPLVGWLDQPWTVVCADMRAAAVDGGSRFLMKHWPIILDTDRTRLANRGLALLRARGQLVDGDLPARWNKHRKFGLGAPFVAVGFRAAMRDAWAGLWTLTIDTLERRCRLAAGADERQRFGSLLLTMVESDAERLSHRGARSTFLRAQAAYHADCARFADWAAAHPDESWRSKLAKARQGYLVRSTASYRNHSAPSLTGRGEAADWLDRHGANVRFVEEKRS